MPSHVYGCGPCCEWNSRHSNLLGRMAEAMGHTLHKCGLTSVALVARDMLRSFTLIRFGLMVGIGGGATRPKHKIHLQTRSLMVGGRAENVRFVAHFVS
jgi:hypothetical protein